MRFSTMSEPEQCIICLEELPRALGVTVANGTLPDTAAATETAKQLDEDASLLDVVAALDGCEHILHDSCIRSWAQKTNTCPICRNPFHSVHVYNGVDGTAISTYHVQDKKQVAEFDAQQWLAQNPEPDEEERNSLPCPICNSSEREDVLLLCDGCDAAYHTYCLGFHDIPSGDWYCMECADRLNPSDESADSERSDEGTSRRRFHGPAPREIRGFHVRTRARLRRARRQARNAEWQGAWGQFSGRLFEMSNLDLDNHDDDEELEQYRRFQQHDQRELQRWQQRVNIAQRLGAREEFANSIPPQISERLDGAPQQPVESPDEIRSWGAFDRARGSDGVNGARPRKRQSRSVTASPAEPVAEPERKLKRPRTRRLAAQGEGAASASTSAAAGPSMTRPTPSLSTQSGLEIETPLVSSLLKELEPNATSEDETAATSTWRWPRDASSPAMSPASSNLSSPRALSTTPPPLPWTNGREASPTLSLSTYIEPRYPPANYSPSRPASDGGDAEPRHAKSESRPLELRQPRPRRPHQAQPRVEVTSPTRLAMTVEGKKNINEIVKSALRPHWRAQKLTTEQYEAVNRQVSRKLYDQVKNVSSLDGASRREWEKRAADDVSQAVAELQAGRNARAQDDK